MAGPGFPLDAYLERIGAGGPFDTGAESLHRLHTAQVFAIPFENLDIHLGRDISLAPAALAEKLIGRRRGGYCFELNGLLSLALGALGHAPRPCLARVLYGRPGPGPRTHQVLLLELGGRTWLADVGFGGPGLRAPIPLEPGRVDAQYGERYRLRRDPSLGLVLQQESGEGWQDLYAFSAELTLPADIDMANFFTSRWPGSPFRQRRICALAMPSGRVTLSDFELAIRQGGTLRRETLEPGPAYLEALVTHFGLELDVAYDAFAAPASSTP